MSEVKIAIDGKALQRWFSARQWCFLKETPLLGQADPLTPVVKATLITHSDQTTHRIPQQVDICLDNNGITATVQQVARLVTNGLNIHQY